MPRQPRSAAKGNSSTNTTAQRIYRVIKPKEFHDHRDAYNGALSFTRPNHLDLKGKHNKHSNNAHSIIIFRVESFGNLIT